MFRNRVFIVSQGWSHKLNLFKNNSADIYKLFNFWHYSNRSDFGIPSGTFFLRHGRLFNTDAKFLHVYIARPLPEKSYTFFIGTAQHIVGLDFTLQKVLV